MQKTHAENGNCKEAKMTVASDKLAYITYITLKNNKNWSTGLKVSVFAGEIKPPDKFIRVFKDLY